MTEMRWRQFKRLMSASSLQVVAVGECGLDYSRKNHCDRDRQQEVFSQQLSLAMELELPVVLHIREVEEDGLTVLDRAGVPRDYPLHRHCFGSDVMAAAKWLEKFPGSMLGVTGLIPHPSSNKMTVKPLSLVTGKIFSAGRESSCSLVLEDWMFQGDSTYHVDQTSRLHFEIFRQDKKTFIVDKSGNGTFVQGKKLTKDNPKVLEHGDTVAVLCGDVELFL